MGDGGQEEKRRLGSDRRSPENLMSQAPFVAPVHPGIQGKSIFPIGMNKRPLFSWGEYAERVPTQEERDSWRHLHDGPWALATGPISGVIVLDFDGLEGAILFQKLKKEGKHVDTWMALTPSKGVHLYYECPNGPLAEKIRNGVRVLPGLDVRAKGGYVGGPCACKDGRKWLTPPIFPPAPLPQWFVETIGKNSSIPVLPPPEGGLPKGVSGFLPLGLHPARRLDQAERGSGVAACGLRRGLEEVRAAMGLGDPGQASVAVPPLAGRGSRWVLVGGAPEK